MVNEFHLRRTRNQILVRIILNHTLLALGRTPGYQSLSPDNRRIKTEQKPSLVKHKSLFLFQSFSHLLNLFILFC
jgi:hypothetical protein